MDIFAEYTKKRAVDNAKGTYRYGGHWYVSIFYFLSLTQNANNQLLRTTRFDFQLLSTGPFEPLEHYHSHTHYYACEWSQTSHFGHIVSLLDIHSYPLLTGTFF